MKSLTTKTAIAFFGGLITSAHAATSGTGNEGNGILIWFLIGFAALIIMLQAVPALVMFGSIVKGIFSPSARTEHSARR